MFFLSQKQRSFANCATMKILFALAFSLTLAGAATINKMMELNRGVLRESDEKNRPIPIVNKTGDALFNAVNDDVYQTDDAYDPAANKGAINGRGEYGFGKRRLSGEEYQPVDKKVQQIVQDVFELDADDSRGNPGYSSRGGHNRYKRHRSSPKGRSVEDDFIVDRETAEHHNADYGGFGGNGVNRGIGNRGGKMGFLDYHSYGRHRSKGYGGHEGYSRHNGV
ncbi:hypothetical protein GHT06_009111 [Daphnia sinensis]|uniref:Uncharacterized protein n=1 Tax=Daphnia sinensis TaxID=1820382 RepID=A0AAD5Q3C3_9CRUS|nr:hypothetical protein GHT06_009111 [Daphnia sinensis]